MKSSLTLGVLGHVDHGKTALVRALTGTETDRLKEERERGLSIVLGFAFLESDDYVIDLIDVPGHESFIRAMIGGATGLDGVLLCVAANEGVKPQTVEHFRIAELLGIGQGFVVITKTDLVDSEMLALVRKEIDEFLEGSFLARAPMIDVSAVTGEGIERVEAELMRLAQAPVERGDHGPFFLPLDRVFSLHGFGLVATGTLRGGTLTVGETVEVLPSGCTATIRALQNHGKSIDTAVPGQRVAVNLRQLGRDELKRGDVLAAPGLIRPTRRIDAELRLLESAAPLKHRAVVHFATGTIEAMAELVLLDRRELAPGEIGWVQIALDRDVATRVSEHFLIRSCSPISTVGGGRILDVNPARHRRFDSAVLRRLETVATGSLEQVLGQRLGAAGCRGIDPTALAQELGANASDLEQLARQPGIVRVGPRLLVAATAFAELLEDIIRALGRFHEKEPFKSGLDAGSLGQALEPPANPEILRHGLRELISQGRISSVNEGFRAAGHDPFARLDDRERKRIEALEQAFLSYGLEAPPPQALVGGDKAKQALFELLLECGRLVRLRTYKNDSNLVIHSSVLENARRTIERKFPHPEGFALKDIRDLLGSTRKYVVPLMEHLDATGATARSGDLRRLRG